MIFALDILAFKRDLSLEAFSLASSSALRALSLYIRFAFSRDSVSLTLSDISCFILSSLPSPPASLVFFISASYIAILSRCFCTVGSAWTFLTVVLTGFILRESSEIFILDNAFISTFDTSLSPVTFFSGVMKLCTAFILSATVVLAVSTKSLPVALNSLIRLLKTPPLRSYVPSSIRTFSPNKKFLNLSNCSDAALPTAVSFNWVIIPLSPKRFSFNGSNMLSFNQFETFLNCNLIESVTRLTKLPPGPASLPNTISNKKVSAFLKKSVSIWDGFWRYSVNLFTIFVIGLSSLIPVIFVNQDGDSSSSFWFAIKSLALALSWA